MFEYFSEPLYAALASFSWRGTLVHERVSQKAQFFAGASQLECPALHGFKKKRRERNVEVKRKKKKKETSGGNRKIVPGSSSTETRSAWL